MKQVIVFNWVIHLIIGFCFAIEFTTQPLEVGMVLLGSLLPDIDHPRSLFGRMNLLVGLMTHRGFCHSVLGCVVLTLPFLYFPGVAPYVFLGTISHLFGDTMQSITSNKKFKLKLW